MSDTGRIEYSPTYDYGTGMGKPCQVVVTPATDTYYYAAECPDCAALRALVESLEEVRADQKARIVTLEAQVEQAMEALEGIAGYWNRDRNDEARHDACWHAIETAEAALQALREGGEG